MHRSARRAAATLLALLTLGYLLTWEPLVSPAYADQAAGRMVMVLDSSGSMKERTPGGEPKITAAKRALGKVITSLPDDQAVGLRVYGAKVFSRKDPGACTDSQLVVPVETGNREALRRAVSSYKPFGETPIGYALQQAGNDLGPATPEGGKRTIVLVSDGEPTCAPDPCKAAKALAQKGVDLKIDVVGLDVDGAARDKLQCIARLGKGTYYDADSADDLSASLTRLATRAARPYATIGTPVQGTPTADGAPEIGEGDYVDELGAKGSGTAARTYLVTRKEPLDTLYVSASVKSAAGNGTDWVSLDARTEDGRACASGGAADSLAGGQLTTASVGVGILGVFGDLTGDDPCASADRLVVTVARKVGTASTPLEVRVRDERPAKDPESLPEKAKDVTWKPLPRQTATPVVGGSSFTDAPVVEPGTYRDTILPGEVLTYQVDAAYGQVVEAQASFPRTAGTKLGDAIGTADETSQVRIYDPNRALATAPLTGTGSPTSMSFLDQQGTTLGAATWPIAYRNGSEQARVAGPYTISVFLHEDPDGESYEVPLTLQVGTLGSETGVPTFLPAAQSASPSASASTSPSASASSAPAPKAAPEGDGGLSPLVYAGALVALAALGGGYLLLRSRSGRAS